MSDLTANDGATRIDMPSLEERKRKAVEYADRAHASIQKVLTLVLDETHDLGGEDRWLMMSRILTGAFQHHFSISLASAGGEMAKRQAAAHAPRPPGETM